VKNYRRGSDGFGISWGVPGLRIGRSQHGTWWIMVGLPFGFRITKRLGRMRDPMGTQSAEQLQPINLGEEKEVPVMPIQAKPPSQPLTKNQEILERIKKLG
jgi:hypothetical protein